eukprot:m.40305 g.40305  ORF g.40305 m.40305 type:complete len:77 (-) comp14801_c0_seq3:61-291(-)
MMYHINMNLTPAPRLIAIFMSKRPLLVEYADIESDAGDTAAAGAALPDGSAEGDSQQQSKKKKKKRKKKDIVTKSF